MINTDGNMESLRRYENEVANAEIAREKMIEDLMDAIQ